MISRSYRCFVVGICAVLLFSACSEPKAGDVRGTWVFNGSGGYSERYIIDTGTLTYDSYPPFIGTIKNSPDFSAQSGVIIIEYVEPGSEAGYFTAVYWRELTEDSVLLANAWDPDPSTNDEWDSIRTTTLAEAQSKFTVANAGAFVSDWGIVQPYHRQ